MPRGRLPSGAVAITALVLASMTVRSPDCSLVTNTRTAGTGGGAAAVVGGAADVAGGAGAAPLHASDNRSGAPISHRCCTCMARMIAQQRSAISRMDVFYV